MSLVPESMQQITFALSSCTLQLYTHLVIVSIWNFHILNDVPVVVGACVWIQQSQIIIF